MFVSKLFLLRILIPILYVTGTWSRGYCDYPEESVFRCDNGNCIVKQYWCDGGHNCGDSSDEIHCPHGYFQECRLDQFECKTNRMCIPEEGYCDGLISCPDGSDEKNCPCENREKEKGSISRRIQVGNYRTHHQCWKFILKEKEKLTVTVEEKLYSRDCMYGNITFYIDGGYFFEEDEETDSYVHSICPIFSNSNGYSSFKRTFTFINDVKIRYTSYFPSNEEGIDLFNITYSKVNTDCLNPEMIKCSETACVSPEKECDGIKDCENGLDEQNCGFVAFSEVFFEFSRKLATLWMRRQHDADWGWKENTPRAIIALYLSNDLNFNTSSHEDELIAKQLELEVSTFLLRNTIEKAPITEMATYISALLSICHNPRNFYGFNLVQNIKQEMEEMPNYMTPFPYLTLCNAKETIPETAIDSLLQIIDKRSGFGFTLEIQALASMTLSCISRNDQYAHLKPNLTQHLNKIKEKQKEDGSFGNEYTTALVIQALIANNQANDRDWKFKAAAEYLQKKQKLDGSFGDFLTTYLIMPVMNGRSLVDLSRINCTDTQNRPREGNPVSDIKNRLGGKIPVKYSLIIGDNRDQVLPILLRTPENITVLDLMTLAADIDPKYKFKTHQMEEKTYVYEISSIPNDPEKNKFWFLYQEIGNDTEVASNQSPDEVDVGENYHMIMWYRTLNMYFNEENSLKLL